MKILSSLLFCVLTCSLLSLIAAAPLERTLILKTTPEYNKCVILTNSGSRMGGQTSFTFYNSCNERVYINACVSDSWGENKLYKSFKAVPVGGRYTIYTFPDMRADQLQWIADSSDPGVPLLCTVPKKK